MSEDIYKLTEEKLKEVTGGLLSLEKTDLDGTEKCQKMFKINICTYCMHLSISPGYNPNLGVETRAGTQICNAGHFHNEFIPEQDS